MTSFYESDAARNYDRLVFGDLVPPLIRNYLHAEADELVMVVKKIKKQVRTVIDFGCGTGKYIRLLSPLGGDYIGLDNSEEMLGIARLRLDSLPNVQLLQHDVCTLDQLLVDRGKSVGICTYNTLGVASDPERFLISMIHQVRDGLLLVSGFDGDKFEASAHLVYDEWDAFVGEQRFGLYNIAARMYTNTQTGFQSRWLTFQDLVRCAGTAGDRVVRVRRSEVGLHVVFDFG